MAQKTIKSLAPVVFLDRTDSRQLSVYISSTSPTTQIYNPGTGTYTPDWSKTNLQLSAEVFLDAKDVTADAQTTIGWYTKIGTTETFIKSGKSLTISTNVLGTNPIITYVCKAEYQSIKAISERTFARTDTGANGASAPIVMAQYSVDGKTGWTAVLDTSIHKYIRHSYDGGKTWTAGIKIAGSDGTSVRILGSYDNASQLPTTYNGSTGDGYLIGGNLYIWNGSRWQNVGNIQGPQGHDGESQYIHIRYATDDKGSNISETPMATTTHIAMYVSNTASPPELSKYVWKKYVGVDGRGIKSVTEYYAIHTSKTVAPTSWKTTIPTMDETNPYLWNYEEIIYTDNTKGSTAPVVIGVFGVDGKGISAVTNYYLTTSAGSGVTKSTTGWTTTAQPLTSQNKYLWSYEKITYTKGEPTETTPHIIGVYGDEGKQGVQGPAGADGKSTYFHVKYAPTATPTASQMSDNPNVYIGTYVDNVEAHSTNPSSYKWVKLQGTDGTQGIPGVNGADGKTSYLHIAYANNATGTSGFSTSDSTNKLYMGQYVDFTSGDSTDPTKYLWAKVKGEDGKGIVSITEHYAVSSSNTTVPTTWQSTVPTTTTTNKYLWNYETITYTTGSPTDTLKRVIGVHGANGSDGRGISTIVNYYLATASASGVTHTTAGWTPTIQNVTATKKYLWNYEEIAYTTGTPTKTEPCIIGAYGDKGETGTPASLVKITPSALYFKSTTGNGGVFDPQYIYLYPTFQTVTYSNWQYSVNGGTTWVSISGANGLSVGTYNSTANSLRIDRSSALYTDIVTSISFRCNSSNSAIYDIVSIAKIYDVVDLQIGARNLALKSNQEISGSGYLIHTYGLSEYLVSGDEYTISICVTPATKVTGFFAFLSTGYALQATMPTNGKIEKQILTATFKANYAAGRTPDVNTANGRIYVYRQPGDSSITENSTIHWIKIEKGNKATDWTPAPEELQTDINNAQETASNAKLKIDNLQVGGRNLIFDSKEKILPPRTSGTSSDDYNYYRFYVDMQLNETYTISTNIEITNGDFSIITVYPYPGGIAQHIPIVDGNIVCTFTKNVNTIDSVLLYSGRSAATSGNGCIFRNVKLEKGNIATDWSPAPEDLVEEASNTSVILSNESHLFEADSNGIPTPTTITLDVVGFKGATQVATTVGTITGLPSTGMGASLTDNATTNTKINIAVNSLLTSTIADYGVLTIPITVNGKVINKKFSWSKSKAGAVGTPGEDAVTFQIYSKNGYALSVNTPVITLQTIAYVGDVAITAGATYQWYSYSNNAWTAISGKTMAYLDVSRDDVSFSNSYMCKMIFNGTEYTSVATIDDKNDDNKVFTTKPSAYTVGDLWIVGSDYVPPNVEIGTLLRAEHTNTIYADGDWVNATKYDGKLSDLEKNVKKYNQSFNFDQTNGVTISAVDADGNKSDFSTTISNTQLSFNEGGQSIASISGSKMHIREAEIESPLTVTGRYSGSTMTQAPVINLGSFSLIVESNGSLSIIANT